MTRVKKSRKEGTLIAKPAKKDKLEQATAKKPKKKLGNKPGSRQGTRQEKNASSAQAQAKDPRIGSKKPIELKPAKIDKAQNQSSKPKQDKRPSVAPIRVVDTVATVATLSIAEQIAAIESDPRLLDMLDKMDEDIALTEAEVNLYNELMAEHEALSAQLPDEEEPHESHEGSDDDDALWDKFDRDDF